jgi:hypothetical protein
MHSENKIQLNAPAGNLPSLIAAVDAGADSVYIGFQSATNLRNLPGLNFSLTEAKDLTMSKFKPPNRSFGRFFQAGWMQMQLFCW